MSKLDQAILTLGVITVTLGILMLLEIVATTQTSLEIILK